MSENTHIEWCDSTLNLEMGCDGCELWNPKAGIQTCYAGVMTRMYEGRNGWPEKFEKPKIFPDRINKALKWKDLTGTDRETKWWLNGYPRTIFLNDMGDTFTRHLPLDWLMPFIPAMEASPHVWMFLTKRPARMKAFFEQLGRVPRNFWLGVSITSAETLFRMRLLKQMGDAETVRWMSVEPVLHDFGALDLTGISAALVGGESGPKARSMELGWVLNIYEAARRDGCRFFLKQWGADKNNPDPADPTMQTNGGMSKGGAQLFGKEWRELPKIKRVEVEHQSVLF